MVYSMEGLLEKIVERKREDLVKVKANLPLRDLKSRLLDMEPARDFYEAISGRGKRRVNLIVEIKKKSPVKGVLIEDLKADVLAEQYEEAGASAISVITEESFFSGNPDYIRVAKKAAKIPVLRKDFLFDEYHIYEARYLGADALLLIAAILDPSPLSEFISLSSELGMPALVEVHDERELATFNVDINTTLRIIKEIPREKVIVSESGIYSNDDVRMLADAGVHAVLVGESIVTAKNISEKIKELVGS